LPSANEKDSWPWPTKHWLKPSAGHSSIKRPPDADTGHLELPSVSGLRQVESVRSQGIPYVSNSYILPVHFAPVAGGTDTARAERVATGGTVTTVKARAFEMLAAL